MKKAPVALLALAALLSLPATASAIPIHRHIVRTVVKAGDPFTIRLEKVVNVAPRDSDKDGVPNRADSCKWTPGSVQGCPPAPAPVPVAPVAAPTPAYSSVAPSAAAGGSGCVGMEAESGSLGYASPNGGCYQVTPGTAANYGCDLSTPDGQDACAADICAHQGPAAWTNPAGENPCGRL